MKRVLVNTRGASAAVMLILMVLLFGAQAPTERLPATQPATTQPTTTQPTAGQWSDEAAGQLPHLTLDREAGHIDLEATVVQQEAKWLELIACSPNSREHEAIVTVPAKPSHIHLALLMLGLEPGEPLQSRRDGDDFFVQPPHGPEVEVFFVLEHDDGQEREVPANQWVRNQQTEQPMAENRWLFTGSEFYQHNGKELYLADLNGTVISLVNFGDDLLTRETTVTNQTDERAWSTDAEQIPPVGTELTVRLRPRPGNTAPATQPADPQERDSEAAGDRE